MITLLSATALTEILVPIAMCVVMPCLIVYFVMNAKRHEIDRMTDIALKSIEKGKDIDLSLFKAQQDQAKNIKMKVFGWLRGGIICLGIGAAFIIMALCGYADELCGEDISMTVGLILALVGLALIIAYFLGRKQFAAEIKEIEDKIK